MQKGNLSTQQAIIHELLAEEQQEFQDRVEAEQVETFKAMMKECLVMLHKMLSLAFPLFLLPPPPSTVVHPR